MEEENNAASSIRAPIAPRHEMLLGDDYGDHPGSMFGGPVRTFFFNTSKHDLLDV